MELKDSHINYVEFMAKDLEKIKEFYSASFDWTFTDYGPTYIAFADSGLAGGFEKTDKEIVNGALVVLYHQNLDTIKNRIMKAGGKLPKIFFLFQEGGDFILLILRKMNWPSGRINR